MLMNPRIASPAPILGNAAHLQICGTGGIYARNYARQLRIPGDASDLSMLTTRRTDNCVFHNVTRGSIRRRYKEDPIFTTSMAATTAPEDLGNGVVVNMGLATTDAGLVDNTVENKAGTARPDWR
jgi:hypothetical protein